MTKRLFSGKLGTMYYLSDPTRVIGVSLDIENYCTIRASPACQRRFYGFCLLVSKIKGRDCGTINGHDESLSIRTLMKDAREVLVR
uniref:Uncharacterized protein n=1 Tax=Yersinia enterocolitica TaxID=630 RepID=B0RKS5_YEREN|nr:hypothetical protein [Yersinia enterocolitica]